jgi:polyisoprenyl-teichoic acid--peptidoglycan teichoic acid transferase
VSTMLGLPLHHHVLISMNGLAAVIDALGGVTVDVGPEPLPIGGVTYSGRRVRPLGYVPPGLQHLNGEQALWYARSRRDSDDYSRMARQRCLIEALVHQNSPTELLLRFRSLAAAMTGSITSDVPRDLLPALVSLVEAHFPPRLRTVSFDPQLADPSEPGGRFRPADPDVRYMREVVRQTLSGSSEGPAPPAGGGRPEGQAGPSPTTGAGTSAGAEQPVPASACSPGPLPSSGTDR